MFLLQQGAEAAKGGEDYVWIEESIWCSVVPRCSPQSLQAAMQLVNIQTLAFTPPHTLPWRVFLYTHTQQTHMANTHSTTLVLGELLYTGEVNQTLRAREGATDEDVEVKEEMEETAHELEQRGDGQEEVKVTLKQQPRDDEALRAFLSILTSVLHTLSSENA